MDMTQDFLREYIQVNQDAVKRIADSTEKLHQAMIAENEKLNQQNIVLATINKTTIEAAIRSEKNWNTMTKIMMPLLFLLIGIIGGVNATSLIAKFL